MQPPIVPSAGVTDVTVDVTVNKVEFPSDGNAIPTYQNVKSNKHRTDSLVLLKHPTSMTCGAQR